MNDLLSKLNGGDIMVLLIILVPTVGGLLLGLVLGVAGILTNHWRRVRQFALETALKQEMVRKGLSAEDIERVIRATHPEEAPSEASVTSAAKELTSKQLDVLLATKLAEAEMDPERLERALGAAAGTDLESKRAVVQAVVQMIEAGTEEEQVHAVILGLCKSSGPGSGSTHHPGLATFAQKG